MTIFKIGDKVKILPTHDIRLTNVFSHNVVYEISGFSAQGTGIILKGFEKLNAFASGCFFLVKKSNKSIGFIIE